MEKMSILSRANQFLNIIESSVFTGKNSQAYDFEDGVKIVCDRLKLVRDTKLNLYLVGNGGSAAVASHAATDFFNVAKLKAANLHESSLLTCMSNDFGYENAYARMLSQIVNPGDVVILISSSGKSMNIRNAALQARENGGVVVTLSGFAADNPLRTLGDFNIWLDSSDYGFVEIGHQFILHNLSDRFGSGLIG